MAIEVTIDLDFTPRSPRHGLPFTESAFIRSSSRFKFRCEEIGIALVDLWNFGWEDGPVIESLGWELSTERGTSHALRKKEIILNKIAPAVSSLRQQGIQIFHCNHPPFLSHYPQWNISLTEEERTGLIGLQEFYDVRMAEKPTRGIRVLFYMGFETDECVMNSTYGIRNMHSYGYMTNIVRDCTTTYKSAETVKGSWRTKVAIEQIEKQWGYSITSTDLVQSFGQV